MAKQGMKKTKQMQTKQRNETEIVPEIQGKSKNEKRHIRAVITGTQSPSQKVYQSIPYSDKRNQEKPISDAYSVIDNDLARDNLENDITDADLQDL